MNIQMPQIQDDPLLEWVEKNLFVSRVYDKIPLKSLATSMASKASVELGDKVTADDIDLAICVVREEKNHNLKRYRFN